MPNTTITWDTWWSDTTELLHYPFVHHALLAAALLGIISGLIAPLIVMRRMSFTVHGTSELALMGASAALLAGINVGAGAVVGSIVAAIALAVLGMRDTDSTVGVILSFGMGLSVLFIYIYPGKASNAFSLLTGQIVGVSGAAVGMLIAITIIVIATLGLLWRPLLFASVDPDVAAASGIPLRTISIVFAALVGLVAAQGMQIVGALLVVSLLITPGAAAVHVTASPRKAVLLSTIFAEVSAVGGLVLSLAPGLPVSVFVTTISFAIYLVCRLIGWRTQRVIVGSEATSRETTPGASHHDVSSQDVSPDNVSPATSPHDAAAQTR